MSVSCQFSRELSVDPGGEAVLEILVRNTGRLVAEFTIEVLGNARGWADVGSPSVRLHPGTEEVCQVTFRPPRSAQTAPQRIPFAIRVIDKEDPDAAVVEEGLLTVNPFTETVAEILPQISHGRLAGRHELLVHNHGNTTFNANLTASDPAGLLQFQIRPPALVAPPGTAGLARIQVRPRKLFLRGAPRTLPFQLGLQPRGQAPTALDASLLQEPLLPAWAPVAAAALIALLVLGIGLWFGVFRPAVQSAAKDAVAATVAKQNADAAKQSAAITAQNKAIDSIGAKVGASPVATPLAPPDVSIDGRLFRGSASYQVGDKKTLVVTDVFFQNPGPDTGPIALRREGGDHPGDLFQERLDDFRSLDEHAVTPIMINSGESLRLVLDGCKPAQGANGCAASVYYTGFLRTSG